MNIRDIIETHKESGRYFFSKDSMRFFNSRVSSYTKGRYFITSEKQDYSYPRLYTVRHLNNDGSIDSVGDFQEYTTLQQAKSALNRAHKANPTNQN